MNTYATYTKATERLCGSAFNGISDLVHFNERVRRLYNRIRKSQLTVYQKENLLELLEHTRETTADRYIAASARKAGAMAHTAKKTTAGRHKELLAA